MLLRQPSSPCRPFQCVSSAVILTTGSTVTTKYCEPWQPSHPFQPSLPMYQSDLKSLPNLLQEHYRAQACESYFANKASNRLEQCALIGQQLSMWQNYCSLIGQTGRSTCDSAIWSIVGTWQKFPAACVKSAKINKARCCWESTRDSLCPSPCSLSLKAVVPLNDKRSSARHSWTLEC